MDLSKRELNKVSLYSDVFRKDCERKIRQIKRNIDELNKRHNDLPEGWAEENGIPSPNQEIEHLVEQKAEAVIIKKKVQLLIKKMDNQTA